LTCLSSGRCLPTSPARSRSSSARSRRWQGCLQRQLDAATFRRAVRQAGLPTDGLKKTQAGALLHGGGRARGLRGRHEIIDLILEQRQLSKLLGTYVDALPGLVKSAYRRLHTSFNQAGAETGRLSSSNPNLQNIPIRSDVGREIRKAFIAEAGLRPPLGRLLAG
jgi:hypothetical protein